MINVKIIADSICNGKRITTYELEYPRFVHAEFMTHRLFSRNAASSRAIPTHTMLGLIRTNPAMPEEWGKNQAGMQARSVFEDYMAKTAEWLWKQAARSAANWAESLNKFGLHKQIVNRVIEPFSHIKVVLTSTEYDNFFWLRNHEDAQPEIRILAEKMYDLYKWSVPLEIGEGEWHVPYYKNGVWGESSDTSLEDALAISASCCAQVSYRKLDDSLEKAQTIYKRLIESKPCHASPFEHQATPMIRGVGLNNPSNVSTWENGVTHYHRELGFGSGNLYGWVQNRQLLKDHTCWEFK